MHATLHIVCASLTREHCGGVVNNSSEISGDLTSLWGGILSLGDGSAPKIACMV